MGRANVEIECYVVKQWHLLVLRLSIFRRTSSWNFLRVTIFPVAEEDELCELFSTTECWRVKDLISVDGTRPETSIVVHATAAATSECDTTSLFRKKRLNKLNNQVGHFQRLYLLIFCYVFLINFGIVSAISITLTKHLYWVVRKAASVLRALLWSAITFSNLYPLSLSLLDLVEISTFESTRFCQRDTSRLIPSAKKKN